MAEFLDAIIVHVQPFIEWLWRLVSMICYAVTLIALMLGALFVPLLVVLSSWASGTMIRSYLAKRRSAFEETPPRPRNIGRHP